MDLSATDFLRLSFFKRLPELDDVHFRGVVGKSIRSFEVKRVVEETKALLLISSVIRKDEGFLWESCREQLQSTLRSAAERMRGFFGFELLTVSFSHGIENFNWKSLGELLVNHSKKMHVGETRLIQCGPMFGVFSKRVSEQFGKIDSKSPIEIFPKEPHEFDVYIKRIIKEGLLARHVVSPWQMLVICDLSKTPIFRFGDDKQTPRIRKLLEKQKKSMEEPYPEIYISHREQTVELFSQFELK